MRGEGAVNTGDTPLAALCPENANIGMITVPSEGSETSN